MKKRFKLEGLECANCAAKMESQIRKIKGIESASISFITGRMTIECNEEKLDEIIKDKSFKNQAKSYHYTKDFTIDSNIQIAFDTTSGYIISSIFQLKIHSIAEEINEEMIFDVTQRDTQNTTSFKDSGIKLNVQDENKTSTNESIMIAILLIVSFTIIILFLIYG